ncbi:aminoglycoside phosphotransferase family protein [Paenibacillus sp. PR3]|uniref:Aminoglycoside phosphotransferase family protein n=1 Tax=Paenibacillus terricola TaxID=2763503 RepID=A0ABR8MTA2_9BACL|nr:aminoglycoside phosphotransferase family protein [Paenibacillus terricola]MBD3919196.1 aminoglycoside phosphotransferase family protein [Paenibacillus terricola]
MTKDTVIIRAEQIAGDFLQEQVIGSYQILDKGMINQVCVVETERNKVVVRMNNQSTYPSYIKEQWCIEQAASAGIPGPRVLSVGICEDTAYMIQSFVEGENGLDSGVLSRTETWRQLGRYAKMIHAIPVKGYGENLVNPEQGEWVSPPHPGSDGSWQGYIQHNIKCLTDEDPLIRLGVLTPEESIKLRELFVKMSTESYLFGLIHGDLTLKNVLVDSTGQMTVIDWGNAAVAPVPHGDLIHLLLHQMLEDGLNDVEFNAYLDGYGMNQEELIVTRQLMLLKSFDTVRWAIDRSPDQIESYAAIAKQVFSLYYK